jgi:HD-GYP domain-containing protein (c-di-GMP phosphodiesterase class II)
MAPTVHAVPGVDLLGAAVDVLADTLGLRDGATGAHCDRTVELACSIGRRFGMSAATLRDLGYAARVHDIGKVGVPDSVLRKPGPLDRWEARLMRRHSEWGADLLRGVPGLERVAVIVHHHHERYDGHGYPDGLVEVNIPLESRILAVADAYMAMTDDRPYRRALSPETIAHELVEGRATQFDPEVVDALELELREHSTAELQRYRDSARRCRLTARLRTADGESRGRTASPPASRESGAT